MLLLIHLLLTTFLWKHYRLIMVYIRSNVHLHTDHISDITPDSLYIYDPLVISYLTNVEKSQDYDKPWRNFV